jgi:hypothetical protein
LDGGVLIPLDGVWYYSSENIHCEHCLHTSKGKGKRHKYHNMAAGAVVKPGSGVMLPAEEDYQKTRASFVESSAVWLPLS